MGLLDFITDIGKGVGGLFTGGGGGSSLTDLSNNVVAPDIPVAPGMPEMFNVDPGGGGGSWASWMKNLGDAGKATYGGLGSLAKATLPFAQLGVSGMNAMSTYRGMEQLAEQNKIARRAQQAQEAALAPVSQFGQEQLRLAAGGQIPAAEEAQIEQWVNAQKQQARDYFARSGQGDSTALRDREGWIEKQAVAMRQAVLENMKRGGLGALTSAAGGYGNVQQGALQQGSGIEQLIQQANQMLAQLAGASK